MDTDRLLVASGKSPVPAGAKARRPPGRALRRFGPVAIVVAGDDDVYHYNC